MRRAKQWVGHRRRRTADDDHSLGMGRGSVGGESRRVRLTSSSSSSSSVFSPAASQVMARADWSTSASALESLQMNKSGSLMPRRSSVTRMSSDSTLLATRMMQKPKGILRVATNHESLNRQYGAGGVGSFGARRRLMSACSSDGGGSSVSFNTLHIREYSREVGDNPSCSCGPPIGIGWDYDPEPFSIDVDYYERIRPPRRYQGEMLMPQQVRDRLLREEWGVPQSELSAAIRSALQTKESRVQTMNRLGRGAKVEEFVESARRKLKRVVLRRRRSTEEIREFILNHKKLLEDLADASDTQQQEQILEAANQRDMETSVATDAIAPATDLERTPQTPLQAEKGADLGDEVGDATDVDIQPEDLVAAATAARCFDVERDESDYDDDSNNEYVQGDDFDDYVNDLLSYELGDDCQRYANAMLVSCRGEEDTSRRLESHEGDEESVPSSSPVDAVEVPNGGINLCSRVAPSPDDFPLKSRSFDVQLQPSPRARTSPPQRLRPSERIPHIPFHHVARSGRFDLQRDDIPREISVPICEYTCS